jgi:hypothetical protein
VGEVERRRLLLPDAAAVAGFLPRPRCPPEGAVATATAGLELASAPACNKLPSSSCNRSIRSWISTAFLREEEDSFTGASYALILALQETLDSLMRSVPG